MGLVMLGTGSTTVLNDLLSYTQETSHEKIIRGVALGIALVMFGKQEEADALIDKLIQVKHFLLPMLYELGVVWEIFIDINISASGSLFVVKGAQKCAFHLIPSQHLTRIFVF